MNWKNEAIEHLTKYDAMVESIKNLPEEISMLELSKKSLRSILPETMPSGKTKGPCDDRLINSIVKRQQLEKSYQDALTWVRTTDRAMSILEPEEQKILEGMYIRPQRGIVSKLCQDLGIEQSTVYRRRDTALYRFTLALYGTC